LNLNFSYIENDILGELFFWIGQLENLEEFEFSKREKYEYTLVREIDKKKFNPKKKFMRNLQNIKSLKFYFY
jgi:hypothetical protein